MGVYASGKSVKAREATEARIQAALGAYLQANKTRNGVVSERITAKRHATARSTLRRRIVGGRSHSEAMSRRQRLTIEEEYELEIWCRQLEDWGWPARVTQLRKMAKEILTAKGDFEPLGKNWVQKWLSRHLNMRSKFVPPLDKSRAMAQDAGIIGRYFLMKDEIIQDKAIQLCDIYNMDEKGCMMGVIGDNRVIVSKDERWRAKSYVTQNGDREWVSLVCCVSADGYKLPLWVIFKGVKLKTEWLSYLAPNSGIAMSPNGWIDNELGLEWFVRLFEPESRKRLKGKYRLLILDGHASPVSTKVITFCVTHNIILLCLPAHTTHILQPLDIGLFAPLSVYYKNLIRELCEFQYDDYAIDKIEFLKVISKAFEEAFTYENVSHSFEDSGITSLKKRDEILSKLRAEDALRIARAQEALRPTTPNLSENAALLAKTPGNIREVERIQMSLETAFAGLKPTSNPDVFDYRLQVEKLSKAVKSSLAKVSTLQRDFNKLHEAQATKINRKNRKQTGFDDGEGRILDAQTLKARATWNTERWAKEEIVSLMRLPVFIGTELQRQKAKGIALRARKRPLTAWQVARIEKEKEQHLLLQELPYPISPQASPKSPTKSPTKSPSKSRSSSHIKSYSKQLKSPKIRLLKGPLFPLLPLLEVEPLKSLTEVLKIPMVAKANTKAKGEKTVRIAEDIETIEAPIIKSARGRALRKTIKWEAK